MKRTVGWTFWKHECPETGGESSLAAGARYHVSSAADSCPRGGEEGGGGDASLCEAGQVALEADE